MTGVISSTCPTFSPIICTPEPGRMPFTSLKLISIRLAEVRALPFTFKTIPTKSTNARSVKSPTLKDDENLINNLSCSII